MGITDRLKGNKWSKPMNLPLAQISNKMVILIAIIGALIAAAFAILIPISALETFTGATGLSEIIPATGAPLGNSARSIFVIFTAILAASIVLVLLLSFRKEPKTDRVYSDDQYVNEKARERNRMALSDDDTKLAERIYQEDEQNYQNYQQNNDLNQDGNETAAPKKNIAAIAGGAIAAGSAGLLAVGSSVKSKINKLPFMGGDDSIKSFDDLPKLRGADKHPDAPARRPLSANEDLGERILDKSDVQDIDTQQVARGNSIESDMMGAPQTTDHDNDRFASDDMAHNPADQIENDVHLQSHDFEEVQEQISEPSTNFSEEENKFSIKADQIIDNDESDDNITQNISSIDAAEADEPVAAEPLTVETLHTEAAPSEAAARANSELPTMDDLMERLGSLVERRSRRVEAQKSEAITPVEIKPAEKMEAKPTDKSEAQLDDYAAVIDHAAIRRAEKSAQNDEKDNREAADIIERPKAALISTDSSQLDDDGDTVVTKSQKAEMDNALKSALDTLHKMTERSA